MAGTVKTAFESRTHILLVSSLLPLKTVSTTIKQSTKYRVIAKSVLEIGIIEPLVVARSKEEAGRYLLLDGHLRHAVLVDSGETRVRCLISEDDEAFT